ncbi:hypothetical protein TNCV_758861 [Trichonephila clavipes]|nr:hypothetical protein TNCV_758861 [Trichonephila clavipes]
MTHVLPLVGHVRFTRKFKNLYRWRGHRGEERRRKEGKKRKESEQDGGNLGGRTGKILRPSSVALKSKNQEINRLQLAVKLPWAIFFESVDILS